MRGRGSGDKAGCLATRELPVPFSAVFVYIVYMDGDRVRVRVRVCVRVCVCVWLRVCVRGVNEWVNAKVL